MHAVAGASLSKLVSIVVPFYNEERNVDRLFDRLNPLLERLSNYQFEVICVDDGSSDKTLQNLIDRAQHDRRIRVVELSRNFGKEAALTAGLDQSSGEAAIPIDADLQDPPEVIERMLPQWEAGAEVVLAKRVDRQSDSFAKRKTAEFFYKLHNRVSSTQIPENVGDFRLLDRAAVNAIKALPEQHRFMKGLFAWIGFNTATVEYRRDPRASGATKFSGWKLWNFAIEGLTSFSSTPLKLWSYIGIVGSLLSFLYASFIIVRTLFYGVDVPGYASLLVVVLFLGSLQLIALGLLGEYIGRIYDESKRRPIYIVRKIHMRKSIGSE